MGSGTAAFFEPYADDPSTLGAAAAVARRAAEDGVRRRRRRFPGRACTRSAIAPTPSCSTSSSSSRPSAARATAARGSSTRRSCARRTSSASRRLGVIASIQPSHCIDDMRWAEKRIGRTRCAIAYDFKSFVDAGVRIAFGTDWFVEPLDPMIGLYAAVTRAVPRRHAGRRAGFPKSASRWRRRSSSTRSGRPTREFAETRKGSTRARQARRLRGAVARPVPDPAARDPRHEADPDDRRGARRLRGPQVTDAPRARMRTARTLRTPRTAHPHPAHRGPCTVRIAPARTPHGAPVRTAPRP